MTFDIFFLQWEADKVVLTYIYLCDQAHASVFSCLDKLEDGRVLNLKTPLDFRYLQFLALPRAHPLNL
jgi:hypothetical protein